MTGVPNTAGAWQVSRDGVPGWSGGPYTWDELVAFAREGRLQATDLVWCAPMPDWVLAGQIEGLGLPPVAPVAVQPRAVAPPATASTAAAPAPPDAAPPASPAGSAAPVALTPGRVSHARAWLVPSAIAAAALIVIGIGAFVLLRGGASPTAGTVGTAQVKLPASTSLVKTAAWGEVPANQVGLLMAEGSSRTDAEAAAKAIGGTIVGEVEFAGVYQVEFPGTSEADLSAALVSAGMAAKVDAAFPNQLAFPTAEIWGVRVDPYADPAYAGEAGDGYAAIGVSKAWSYIKGSGADLSPVKVGVVDSGLYMPGAGAENEFSGGKVNIEFPDPAAGSVANAQLNVDGSVNPAGNHGTAVSTVIAGDPDNGGPAGVAGPLGDRLTLSLIDRDAGQYGSVRTAPDPADPTKAVLTDGRTYSLGLLVALTKEVGSGAKVINCSWGNSQSSTSTVAAFTRFFTKMSKEHPEVLFVCSGGNGGKVMDGTTRFPGGLRLPNMVTVGWLNNDGTTAADADRASETYEITLGAPGTGTVVGLDASSGAVRQDGSSFAAPQVTAAAAILQSLDPRLTAGEIKQILSDTARPGVVDTSGGADAHSHPIGAEMGGRILAVDEAVLRVINDLRVAKGLPRLTGPELEKMAAVDAVAVTGDPGDYTVRGIVGATGTNGTDLKIEVFGENTVVGGASIQSVAGAGEARWSVTLGKNEGTIKVTRRDNGAASIITIQPGGLEGTWEYPDVWGLEGTKPQETGLTLTMTIVRSGDGYKVTKGFTVPVKVTLEGANVTIEVPVKGGPDAVYSGVLSGDTIKGERLLNSAGWVPWVAHRRK